MHAFSGYLDFSSNTMSSIGGLLSLQARCLTEPISYFDFQDYMKFAPLQTKWIDLLIAAQVTNQPPTELTNVLTDVTPPQQTH